VPIVNRQSDVVSLKLFGHPNILYLPSKLTGTFLYQTVDRVVPCLAYYSIHLTDGQVGRLHFCSMSNLMAYRSLFVVAA